MAEVTPDEAEFHTEAEPAPPVFPLFNMVIEGDQHWLPLSQAGIAYDSGFARVSIGGLVLDGPGIAREITAEERMGIADIADDYSASK